MNHCEKYRISEPVSSTKGQVQTRAPPTEWNLLKIWGDINFFFFLFEDHTIKHDTVAYVFELPSRFTNYCWLAARVMLGVLRYTIMFMVLHVYKVGILLFQSACLPKNYLGILSALNFIRRECMWFPRWLFFPDFNRRRDLLWENVVWF